MKKLEIDSFIPKNVILGLAEAWNISPSVSGNEYVLDVPDSWGQGQISAVQFEGGFGLMKYDCEFLEDLEIHFVDSSEDPLKFLYCLKGNLQIRFADKAEDFTMEKYNNCILASRAKHSHLFRFPGQTFVRIRSIEIDKTEFHTRFHCEPNGCHSQLQKIFEDHEDEESFFQDGMYSVTLAGLFDRLDGFSQGGILRAVYLEGTVLKILSQQLMLYEDDLNGANHQRILRRSEMELIHQAAQIIEDELEDLGTVPDLAHRVGFNINKLQDGFRMLYHMTVNQYIHTTRMKRATTLLRYSDLNISEIVHKVGLSSKSYFSKIFKEEYGITPTQYRKEKWKIAV